MSKIPRNTRRAGFLFGGEPADPCLLSIATLRVGHPTIPSFGNSLEPRGAVILLGAPIRRHAGLGGNKPKWVGRLLDRQVGCVRQLWRRVGADVNLLAMNAYLCAPSAMRVRVHTKESTLVGLVRGSNVLHVLARRSLAQIVNSVVAAKAVLVVKGAREHPIDIEPCKTVSRVFFSINADRPIAVTSDRSSNAFTFDWAAIKAPTEIASQRIVVKQFTKPFGGKRIVHGRSLQATRTREYFI